MKSRDIRLISHGTESVTLEVHHTSLAEAVAPRASCKPGRGRSKGIHAQDWKSGNCKSAHHRSCFSLACTCECHLHKG